MIGLKYGLLIHSPVDDDGKCTEEAGKFSVIDVHGGGHTAVIEYLDEHMSIIMVEPYSKLYFLFLLLIVDIVCCSLLML